MQALMLAAGMGRRLGKYTEACTKCMLEVGGQTLLERTVESLQIAGIQKMVLVVGWECEKLVTYINQNITGIEFEFIYNYDYASTNNIYSLYMAREQLAQDDTILLESDLIFDKNLVKKMVDSPNRNLVAVSKYEQWMDGTVTTLMPDGSICAFINREHFQFQKAETYFKTVNIYKFSVEFSKQLYIPFLEAYITAYGKNLYYEQVFQTLTSLSCTQLKAFVLTDILWYEIDNICDLNIANILFSPEDRKLELYEQHLGGIWNFSGLKDFCYSTNPYFPPPKMIEQMKYFYTSLLTQYPSGLSVQRLLAGRMFSVDTEYLLVGNGAAELIEVLGRCLKGRLAVSIPAFNEYIRCFPQCEIVTIPASQYDFQLNVPALLEAAASNDILAIVNPDNPSGSFLTQSELTVILDRCREHGTLCIVDESFIDFAEKGQRYTFLRDDVLEAYPNMILIKSISKSYGIPGLRLGVLASADRQLIEALRSKMPIWNINSFAEYFLQIFPMYQQFYEEACDQIATQRSLFSQQLAEISFLQVYPSQANYIMCAIKERYSAKELATHLISKHNILIKDLTSKAGFNNQPFIRIAVKNAEENQALISAIKSMEEM